MKEIKGISHYRILREIPGGLLDHQLFLGILKVHLADSGIDSMVRNYKRFARITHEIMACQNFRLTRCALLVTLIYL